MRKILIAILIILLISLAVTVVLNGMHVSFIDVLGYYELSDKNNELDEKINEASMLTGAKFETAKSDLSLASKKLSNKKEEYQDKVAYSSEEEVKRATEIKTYQVDYLFSHIGNYAENKYGLDLKIDANPTSATGVYDINFTVKGKFVYIAEFIRSIENDNELNFVIERFKIVPGDSTEILTATFTVSQIRLDIDNSITNTSSTLEDDDTEKPTSKRTNNN
ncbi:MAG: hypothetical protein IKP28_02875 [Clostridia bacterium]|nr:hypothetical protein [Clostridia bacterium]